MKLLVKNKKIYFDYEIQDTVDAGIVLVGHEVKALKTQGANIRDALVRIEDREARIINMDIPRYQQANRESIGDYDAKGKRKLLLTKRQIARLRERTQKTGLHIVPTKVYADKNGRIKVTIGIAKRKRKIQKRQSIKDKDTQRMMDKAISRVMRS